MLTCKLPAMETTVSVTATDKGTEMRVEVWPSMHIVKDSKKEPMVEYMLNNGTVFVLPERYIRCDPRNFLVYQLDTPMDSRVQRDTGVTKMQLEDPVFQDTFVFALMLDYLKRKNEEPSTVTLRRADTELTDDEWRKLNELEHFIFNKTDRNPYWSGLTDASFMVDGRVHQSASALDMFTVNISPGCLSVKGPGGFELRMLTAMVNCTPENRPKSVLEARVQQLTGTPYPFPVDFVHSFFVPHNHIRCRIEGKTVRCEGVIHSSGSMRIEPVDDINDYMWFHFSLNRRAAFMPPHYTLAYGVLEEESKIEPTEKAEEKSEIEPMEEDGGDLSLVVSDKEEEEIDDTTKSSESTKKQRI